MIRVGIAGGAGYTAGELLRVLAEHPHAEVVAVQSRSQIGRKLTDVHEDLWGYRKTEFVGLDRLRSANLDVLFLCLGHGESRELLDELNPGPELCVVDLANDFRLAATSHWKGQRFAYGLIEDTLGDTSSRWIANPGCFATALQLALLPVADQLHEVFATGITGSTGAGQKPTSSTHFSWRANNIQSYKVLEHQHVPEVLETLHRAAGSSIARLHFVPWRGDFPRGIHVSCSFAYGESKESLNERIRAYYAGNELIEVMDREVDLKLVVNTNRAAISVNVANGIAVVHCAIDNLLKGAAGQAIQNMNRIFGLPVNEGLHLKPLAF